LLPWPERTVGSIVAHTQAELLVVIADFDLDPLCLRGPQGIPEGFGSNLINFITKDRMKISRLAFNRYMECRRSVIACWISRELFS